MRNVIVTGGAGFIGSALTRHLIGQLGWQVTVVDKLTYAASLSSLNEISNQRGYRFFKADILDRKAMDQILADVRPDAIMHLAAETHVDRSISSPSAFITTNVVGTHTLLEAVRSYWMQLEKADRSAFRFLHVSTDEVYGSLEPDQYFTERSTYDPRSPYAASKAASDHLVSAWHNTYGLPTITTNCSNNYGPYHYPEKLIPLVILNALEGKPIPIFGDGCQQRDWLYVDDHVHALVLALERGQIGQTYVVGGRAPRANIEVVKCICDELDFLCPADRSRRHLITHVADRLGHDRRYAIDPTRIETELGWRARQTFETGIKSTVRWYLDRRDWWVSLRRSGFDSEFSFQTLPGCEKNSTLLSPPVPTLETAL